MEWIISMLLLQKMDIEELEDLIAWNLSFGIPIHETLKELKIKKSSQKINFQT